MIKLTAYNRPPVSPCECDLLFTVHAVSHGTDGTLKMSLFQALLFFCSYVGRVGVCFQPVDVKAAFVVLYQCVFRAF